MNLAEAKEKLNQQKMEKLRLKREEKYLSLSTEEIRKMSKLDIEGIREQAKNHPTSDLSSRGRELQAKVFALAKSSKNLKGTYVRKLKKAAVTTMAYLDVLRSRADEVPDTDMGKEVSALRKELEAKREMRRA